MKRYKRFLTFSVLALSAVSLASAALTPDKELKARQPLRFRHARAVPEGLYAVPGQKKVCNAPALKSTTTRTELVANCITSKIGYGMYSFFAEPNASLDKIAETPAFFGGGVYVNGKYYGMDYDYDSNYELEYVEWYVYDATTWRREKVVSNPCDYSYIATDRTYDSTTGTVYSVTYDKTGNAIQLSKTSLTDGAPTPIAPLTKNVIMIAASPQGQLYGIDTEANLYRINKSNAELTLVGNTKIYDDYISEYTQSITFDPRTGKILWAEFHSEGWFSSSASLFEVDPATAAATKIADLSGAPELMGLYVTDMLQSGVPEAARNLTVIPASEGSLSCSFSFTAPAVTTDGDPLNGNMTLEVNVDGDLIDILEAAPGQKVTTVAYNFSRGLHTVKLTADNAAGTGAVAAREFFAGYDVPAAPGAATFTFEDGKAQVSWTAPKEGAEGGAIRTPLTYNVTRMPDAVKVAEGISQTSFSETIDAAKRYSYIITAVSPDGEGVQVETNSLVAGSCEIPFITSFDTKGEFDMWTIVDVTSGANKLWNYDEENHRLRHPWSMDNAMDDWIISPGLKMDGAKTYSVSFDAYQMVANYNEHVMLYFGPSQDISEMTLILDTEKLGETAKNYEGTVAPSESGVWYIAFRSTAPRNGFMSYVDNVRVLEKGSSAVAAGVQNFKAEAADGGELSVAVSFDAPKTTMQGGTLSAISYIDLLRGESSEPVKTFDAPAPGEHLTWTDNSVKRGIYTYRAIVYTSAGAGEPVSAKVFAGVDVPEAPTDFSVSGEEGARELSWKAPAQGQNGGNLNGVVGYKVVRVVNDKEEVVESDLKATSYTDTWTTKEQAFVYYAVSAVTSAGESESVTSRSFAVGEPYDLPYNESFADAAPQTNPWGIEQVVGAQGEWAINKSGENPYASAQDGDNGIASFDGYHGWTDGVELRLITPTIGLSHYKDVVLSFYLYHYNGIAGWWQTEADPVGETMKVEVSADGGPFKAVSGADFTLYDAKSGWQKHDVALDDYAGVHGIRIAFRGKGAANFNIHLDNITVDGTYFVSGVNEVTASAWSAKAEAGAIVVEGVEDLATVYDMAGRRIATLSATQNRVEVAGGIYLVSYKNETVKVLVK